jgi:uncharacterized protein YcbK (DUF882 family)
MRLVPLLASLAALAFASGVFARDAGADETAAAATSVPSSPPLAKKEQYITAKEQARAEANPEQSARERMRWHAELERRIGKPPPPQITIFNTWTHEYVVFDAKPRRGEVEVKPAQADHFLRCHFTNQPTQMDPRLLPLLLKAARSFRVYQVEIVSGFRAPKYNLMLRKKGHQVARNSQHTVGHAVDFRLPGIPAGKLLAWARRQRMGGVGFYRNSGFVHVDTGPVRFWAGE